AASGCLADKGWIATREILTGSSSSSRPCGFRPHNGWQSRDVAAGSAGSGHRSCGLCFANIPSSVQIGAKLATGAGMTARQFVIGWCDLKWLRVLTTDTAWSFADRCRSEPRIDSALLALVFSIFSSRTGFFQRFGCWDDRRSGRRQSRRVKSWLAQTAFWAARHWSIHPLRPAERVTRRREGRGRQRERDGRENASHGAAGIVRGVRLQHGPFTDGAAMVHFARVAVGLAAAVAAMASLGAQAPASRTSGQRDLPNPDRPGQNWPTP